MTWEQLSTTDAHAFIKAVADDKMPALFELSVCDVYTLPLSFYDGYHLTRIVNRHMLPYLLMDYLSNGEDHYYMDGSEQAFHNLNARRAISLDEENVSEYLDFYISYVYERGNSLTFQKEPGEASPAKILEHGEGIYKISVTLNYQNSVVEGLIDVHQNGSIHVQKPIRISFLENLKPTNDLTYNHPHEEQIITHSLDILSNAKLGQCLIDAARAANVNIRVLSSPNYHSFTAHGGLVYLILPAAEQTAKYLQALQLAGALHDTEQIRRGYLRPHPVLEQEIFANMNYGKNLDILLEMCRIIEELEDKNILEALGGFKRMGFSSFYQGFKQGVDIDALQEIYIDCLVKKGLLPKNKDLKDKEKDT